jgi:hypothetical protein
MRLLLPAAIPIPDTRTFAFDSRGVARLYKMSFQDRV